MLDVAVACARGAGRERRILMVAGAAKRLSWQPRAIPWKDWSLDVGAVAIPIAH
jgi:hypothetical protein